MIREDQIIDYTLAVLDFRKISWLSEDDDFWKAVRLGWKFMKNPELNYGKWLEYFIEHLDFDHLSKKVTLIRVKELAASGNKKCQQVLKELSSK